MPERGPTSQGSRGHPGSLEDLMQRLVQGDRPAFDSLFAALWGPVLRYAQHLLGDATGAQDVAQRALIRLFEEAPGYRVGSPVLAWALSLTFWEARTERKRRTRSKTNPLADDEMLDERPNALEQLMDEQARHELSHLVEELDAEERAVLGLDDAKLLTLISPSAVRKRRQRLIARLREALKDLAFARNDEHE